MKGLIFTTWERLNSSFWFVPALMSAAAVGLAFATVALDERVPDEMVEGWGWVFGGGAEGAGAVLRTIAGSMIALAGVVFSMTLVVLSLASSQLGPRVLRNFMRDTPTQVVLGTFVATFLYCLLVLRTVRRAEDLAFVPNISVTAGVLLAVLSVGVLVFFVHHVSVSIQANEIAARIGKESIAGLDRIFPEHIGHEPSSAEPPATSWLDTIAREASPVAATDDGYLQFIDGDSLLELAIKHDAVLRLERRPGEYVVAGSALVGVWPPSRLDEELSSKICSTFAVGNQRTPGQDFAFANEQLVEIAVRALSSGMNDPFTATVSIDRLGSVLSRLAQRKLPSPYRYDAQDQLRIIAPHVTFAELTDAAFDQIRQYGSDSTAVLTTLLDTIIVIAGFTQAPADRAALWRHATLVLRAARRNLPADDRRAVEQRFLEARAACRH
jgi:uncharacterized membrane protein